MDNKTTTVNTGTSSSFLLFLVFLVLKLTNVINWSWWWITAPLWVPIALLFSIVLVFYILIGISYIIDTIKDNRL